jgi:hypothetical protein
MSTSLQKQSQGLVVETTSRVFDMFKPEYSKEFVKPELGCSQEKESFIVGRQVCNSNFWAFWLPGTKPDHCRSRQEEVAKVRLDVLAQKSTQSSYHDPARASIVRVMLECSGPELKPSPPTIH